MKLIEILKKSIFSWKRSTLPNILEDLPYVDLSKAKHPYVDLSKAELPYVDISTKRKD